MKNRVLTSTLLALVAVVAGCSSSSDNATESAIASGRLSVVVTTEAQVGYSIEQNGELIRLDVEQMKPSFWPETQRPVEWRTAGGSPVRVFGRKKADGAIQVEHLEIDAQPRGGETSENVGQAQSALVTSGVKRALVMEITFDGGALLTSDANVKSKMAAFATDIQDASFGQLTLNYDVVGPYNIAFGSCDNYGTWVNDAKALATKNGVNLANYNYFSLVVPAPCGYGGMGEQPGTITWIAAMDTGVFLHELGHNFGNWHASSRKCTSSGVAAPMGDACTMDEYGDPFDSMGNAYAQHHYNAVYKSALGWIPVSRIATASGTQTYTLAPENMNVTGTQLLRIPGSAGVSYAVDFRQPTATDSYAASDPAVKGVLVYAQFPGASDADRVQLLDMTPSTSTFSDAALAAGKSYTFWGTSTTLEVTSVSAAGAVVKVTGAPVAPPAPQNFVLASSGKCLSIEGTDKTALGANTVQRTCDGAKDQAWTAALQSDGAYTMTNRASNRCLDIYGANTTEGGRVEQWDCWSGAQERWKQVQNANGTVSLVNSVSQKCLGVAAGNTAEGGSIAQFTCDGSANQQFRATIAPSTLKVVSSGKCLAITGTDKTALGADTVQRTCDGGKDELWVVTPQTDGTSTLTNFNSNRCLDVYNASTADGARVEQWDCWSGAQQRWRLTPQASGAVSLVNASTGKCLDDLNVSTADGAKLAQWTCTGGTNQQFTLQ